MGQRPGMSLDERRGQGDWIPVGVAYVGDAFKAPASVSSVG
jgi:hypothetical protein